MIINIKNKIFFGCLFRRLIVCICNFEIMKNIKFIIIYNQCLRSKLIYYSFIKKNKNNIHSVIKIPVIKKKSLFSEIILFLKLYKNIRGFIFSILSFKLLFLISYRRYLNQISSIYVKKKISFFELNEYPNNKFWKKINLKKNYIVFSSTTHILKKKELSINNLILNFHEADPRILRGSALYFQLMAQNFHFLRLAYSNQI